MAAALNEDTHPKDVTIEVVRPPMAAEAKSGPTILQGTAAVLIFLTFGMAVAALALVVPLVDKIHSLETQLSESSQVLVSASATAPQGFTGTSALLTGAGEWAPGAFMPEERSDFHAVACEDGKIVLLGGLNHSGHVVDTVWIFDPTSETYSVGKAPMPTGRYRFGAVCLNNKVYAAGGYPTAAAGDAGQCLSTVDIYDTAADTWSSAPALTYARGDLALTAVGVKLYAMGGYGYEYPYPDPANEANEVLDTGASGGGWTAAAKVPGGGKGDITGVNIGGQIFLPGGWNGVFKDELLAYDPPTDTWATSLAPMKAPRGDKAVAALDGHLFVIGGESWSGKKAPCAWDPSQSCDINQIPIHSVEQYSPARDTWSSMAPLPEGRFRFAAAVANGAIFAFGGHAHGELAVNTAWVFHYVPQPNVYFHTRAAAAA